MDEYCVIWNDAEFSELSDLLDKKIGFSLTDYKVGCISRRLASRLYATNTQTITEYIRVLKRDPNEFGELFNALTINVSSFFRNSEAFDYLAEKLIPGIVQKNIAAGRPSLNIWSAGCSTGEEPYSVAIIIVNRVRIKFPKFDTRILATDIDSEALDSGRKGIYPKERLENLDKKTIKTCFTKLGEKYRIKDSLREMVEFRQQNILKFEKNDTIFDIIICRNMLIYFTQKNHVLAYHYFSDHLATGGYLMLGKAEIIFFPGKTRFEVESSENHVYRKINNEDE